MVYDPAHANDLELARHYGRKTRGNLDTLEQMLEWFEPSTIVQSVRMLATQAAHHARLHIKERDERRARTQERIAEAKSRYVG